MAALTDYITISQIETLLGDALSKGGEFADVYVERSVLNSVVLDEGKIKSGGYRVAMGVGIRVIDGFEVGYAYSDDLDPKALRETALVAAGIASKGGRSDAVRVSRTDIPDHYRVDPRPDSHAPREKIEMLRRGEAAARAYDPRITEVNASFVDSSSEVLVATSDGHYSIDDRVMCRIGITAFAQAEGEREIGSSGGGGRVGLAFFTEEGQRPEDYGKEAARMAIAQLGAAACPAGPQTVVLSPGWSGVLLHEAVGHGLEADFIAKNTSLYAGQVGEQVASELVTVIDNGELPHRRGSLNVDDEGVVTQNKVLIEKGILKGFMSDRLSGKRLGIVSTGSGRRESYAHYPMPRMTNTYMAAGPHTHDEIIASVDKGLYCANFGGGQVDISNGNFVFKVNEGYLIEKGKIGQAVKGATLIGVGPDALKKVSMVADNPRLDSGVGTCGKDGQSVPVGVGQPTLRMDEITVGGTAQ